MHLYLTCNSDAIRMQFRCILDEIGMSFRYDSEATNINLDQWIKIYMKRYEIQMQFRCNLDAI